MKVNTNAFVGNCRLSQASIGLHGLLRVVLAWMYLIHKKESGVDVYIYHGYICFRGSGRMYSAVMHKIFCITSRNIVPIRT